MELKYLKTVLITAEYLNFSRAAEEIPCAQSSVSRQVESVESELGAKIFSRSKSGAVALTDYGIRAIPLIQELVEKYDELCDAAADAASGNRINYRLGLVRGPFNAKIRSAMISEMFLRHPKILLTIQEVPRQAGLDMLLRGSLDALVFYQTYLQGDGEDGAFLNNPGIVCHELFGQIPHIAMPVHHPLTQVGSVAFDALRNETFLLPQDEAERFNGTGSSKSLSGFLQSCLHAGFTPKIEFLARETIADIRDVLVTNYGWMYPTFQTRAMRDGEKVAFLPAADPLYYAKYYMITSTKKTRAFQCVMECIKELLTDGDEEVFTGPFPH